MGNEWKQELTKRHNEENPPPTKEVVSLLRIAEDDIDANSYNVRIPYEDLDYLYCGVARAGLSRFLGSTIRNIQIALSILVFQPLLGALVLYPLFLSH